MSGIAYAIITGILTLITGAATAGINNAIAKKRESEAREENYALNEQAAENADTRGRNIYTDTGSPKAQVQQLKEAGLSPSLFYSGGGNLQGASTGAMGTGASGINPNVFGMGTPKDLVEMSLMKAQANKAQAEADLINGDNERGQAEINKIVTETYGKKAEAEFTKIRSIGEEINNRLANATYEDNVNYAHYKSEEMYNSAQKLAYEVITARSNSEVDAATIQTRINQEENKNELLKADVLFRQSSIKLNDAQIDKIKNECEMWREQMLQNWVKLIIDKQNAISQRITANASERNAYSYQEFVQNLEDFQDAQIQNLKDRLAMDEDHFNRKQKLEYLKLLQTMYDNAMARGTQLISSILPMATNIAK